MYEREKKFWDCVLRQKWKILFVAATILSMCSRFAFRGFISGDMRTCLLDWYDQIKNYGGWNALSYQVGNYQISYQTAIALMTYLPVNAIYAYKIFSIVFDYGLAIEAALVVREISKDNAKAVVAYALVANIPTTVLNSAAWGQCDSIYTFFLIAAFVNLIRGKNTRAFLLYGVSFAFKLQAIFFLPFLVFYYVWSRKFSATKFLLIPLLVEISGLGGILQGRSILSPFEIYAKQSVHNQRISMNYPSFWNTMVKNFAKNNSDYYPMTNILCIAITILLLGLFVVWLLQKKKLTQNMLLEIATVMIYTCVLFLPSMHERYVYAALPFVVMVSILNPKLIPAALGMIIIDLQTYGLYLFELETLPWSWLVILNISCYLFMVYQIQKEISALVSDPNR